MTAAAVLGSGITLAQDAVLHAVITDAATGRTTPCTVAITDANGKTLAESDSFKSGFRCAGEFTKSLLAGRTRLRVTRGFETKAVEREIDLVSGRETDVNLVLERVVDLRRRGWYAGDSHVHMLHGERTVPVDFDFVALSARAEDLQYMSLAQAWTLDRPTPEALEGQLRPRSTTTCVLTWNLEAPKNYYKGDAGRCLGHCWNMGMRGRTKEGRDVVHELLEASAWDYESGKPTYANFESHSLVHAQGGAVFYTHPARWWLGSWGGQGGYPKREKMRVSNMAVELPLDTLVGPTFDGLDVITTSGEQAANAKAFELWCLLLNHGYRLAATASSDACFDRPGGGLPGAARTYTFLPNGFSFAEATRATAAGRTFATTGPLLLATIDGQPPGSAFAATEIRHELTIEAWAPGDDSTGLSKVEILRNGQIFQEFSLQYPADSFRTNVPIKETGPAWYCVRAAAGRARDRLAISGAFYFEDRKYQPPTPVRVQARVQIVDAISGQPLEGTITEVTYEGTFGRDLKRYAVRAGGLALTVPGTLRLRALSKGYLPLTLSPFLDCPDLVATVSGLSDSDLLDWKTFERLREQLGHVDLVFRLNRK